MEQMTTLIDNKELGIGCQIIRMEQEKTAQALADLTKAQADLVIAKSAAKPTKSSTVADTPFKKSDGSKAAKKEEIDHTKRIEVSTLFTREQRSTFDYEDKNRILASISKGIHDGYQEFDLDALMRNDKGEDRSKALQAITSTIQCNQRLKEKLLPFGTAEVFQITLLDPDDLTKVRKTVDLFTEFSKVDEAEIIESCNTYCEMSDNK